MFSPTNPRASEESLLFWVLLVGFSLSLSLKLNVPSVLLSYNKGLPSNYTIRVTGAKATDCFHWQSEDGSIVQVNPLYETSDGNCSQKAIISSVLDAGGKKVTKVTAFHRSNLESSELICEVFTDSITSLQMVSIAHELSVDGPPLMVKVIAKDKSGHVFTSINGLQIKWDLESNLGETKKEEIIKISTSNELYENVDDVEAWEMRGMLGYSIFLTGINAGTVKLRASVVNLKSTEVLVSDMTFKVLPKVKTTPPSPIYLLKHSFVNINVNAIDKGKHIKVDESNFRSVVENLSVLEESFSKIIGKEFGSTQLTLENTNDRYPSITVDLHVVRPAFLVIRISSGGFKKIEEMKSYTVSVEMYDENENMIHLSDNIRVMLSFPSKLFHVNFTTSNGTYCVVQAIAPGTGNIRAEFKGLLKEGSILSKEAPISAVEDVTVYQRLSIFPRDSFLPYDKSIMPHKISLKVTGGSGEYLWAVNNPKLVSVVSDVGVKSNIAEIYVYNETDLIVTVTDKNNVNIITFSKIAVKKVVDIDAYPTVVEAEIANVLIIPVALYGSDSKGNERKFDDCSKIEPIVEVIEKQTLSYEKEAEILSYGKGCLSLQFRCKYSGYSRVNIMYHTESSDARGDNITLKTTTVLACFKPLKPVHPVRVAVLALGTSKEVAFEGGPRKWPLFRDGHYTKLESLDTTMVDIQLLKDPVRYNKDLTVFRVKCKGLGEFVLSFRIGNEQSATNHHPAKSEATIKLICAKPATLHLKQTKKQNKKLLKDENIVKVPFYGTKQFSIDVWLKDSVGRKFGNASSFSMEWEVSDEALAEPVSSYGFATHDNAVDGYRKIIRDFKEFKMSGVSGKVQVRAKVTGYNVEVLAKEGVPLGEPIEEVSGSIDLNLVSLRDLNVDQYATDAKEEKDEYCDDDSCRS